MEAKKKIIIIGAGGLGRELYSWLKDFYVIEGFIDDDKDGLDGLNYPVGIISTISEYTPDPTTLLAMGIMTPSTKKAVASALSKKGAKFLSFIHPSAIIGQNVEIEDGSIICPLSIVTCDSKLGAFTFLNVNSTIGHDSAIGDYSSINSKVEIGGNCKLGEQVLVGSRSVILPGKKIANNAIVGSGSVVVGHITRAVSVFGNPARVI